MTYPIDLTNDFVFRHIFGDDRNADILLSLVNAILENKGLERLTSITAANPYLNAHDLAQREGILDVRATDADGRNYDIEIQVCPQKSYIQRSIYYLARLYSGQLKHGSDYHTLEPCVGISLLDFVLFKDSEHLHHYFTLRSADNGGMELSKDLSLHYLEIPKLRPGTSGYSNLLEKWLYFMKEIKNPEDPMIKEITSKTPEMKRAEQAYTTIMTDDQLRMEALSHEMWVHDQATYRKEAEDQGRADGLEQGLKQGLKQGLEQGLEQGRSEGALEQARKTAKKMKETGLSMEQISVCTGLSLNELHTLFGTTSE